MAETTIKVKNYLNKNQLISFLMDINRLYLQVKTPERLFYLSKYHANPDFTFLWGCSRRRTGDETEYIEVNKDLNFLGFYSTIDQRFYADCDIEELCGKTKWILSIDQVRQKISNDLAERVSEKIYEKPELVKQTISGSVTSIHNLELNESDRTAENDAYRNYLKDVSPESLRFVPSVTIRSSNAILEWLKLGDSFLEEQADKYIEENRCGLQSRVKYNEKIIEKLNFMYHSHGVHETEKKLLKAVSNHQSVSVTIYRNGHELTFRYATYGFSGFHPLEIGKYYASGIISKDPSLFNEINQVFKIDEIVRVTYRGKIIFEQELPGR